MSKDKFPWIAEHRGKTPLPEQACCYCGHPLNMSTLGARVDPKSILLSRCAYCDQFMVEENGTLRKPQTDLEVEAIRQYLEAKDAKH